MAKGPGGTRSGNSGNPSGNGGARINASRPSQLEIEDRIIALEGERERLRNEGSGNGPGFDTVRIDQINDEIDELRERYSQTGRLQNASLKLNMSDLKFVSSRDDEAIDAGAAAELTRWDADGISYQDGRTTKQGRATITQFLKRGSNEIGGYEIYFDKASPVGEARTLEEAKQKLLNYINSKRR